MKRVRRLTMQCRASHILFRSCDRKKLVHSFPPSSYLLKLFSQRLPSAQLPDNMAYLGFDYPVHKYSPVRRAEEFMDPPTQLEAYRQRARRYSYRISALVQSAG